MTLKIGINGFGRIGRLTLRLIEEIAGLEVVAINDLTDAKTLTHLLKYDSVHGRFAGEADFDGDQMIVNGRHIQVSSEADPKNIPWVEAGVELVIEATGHFKTREQAKAHLDAGAKRVVLSAPGSDDIDMVVFGVNEDILDGSEEILSTGSCTTNCLAPMALALEEEYGIEVGLMTTIHAYTADQNLQDAPHKELTRARAAAENIVPTSTGAAKSIGKVIPALQGKLDGSAQRVPVIDGSVTELTVTLSKETNVEEINALMASRANESFGYTEDPIVSTDVIGVQHGSLFDATQTRVQTVGDKQLVRVVSWYDNETGFVAQMLRVVQYLETLN